MSLRKSHEVWDCGLAEPEHFEEGSIACVLFVGLDKEPRVNPS